MSTLRPECGKSDRVAVSDRTAFQWVRDAVFNRRSLIRGVLDADDGRHCAMGCMWDDHPTAVVSTALTDMVAAVNDAVPDEKPRDRRKRVLAWLDEQLSRL